MMRPLLILVFVVLFSGCSTLRTTVGDSQEHAVIVYSGIRLNDVYWHCGLYGAYPHEPNWPGSLWLIPYTALDFVFSFMADTLLIPYSIYAKVNEGGEYIKKLECSELKPYFGTWS